MSNVKELIGFSNSDEAKNILRRLVIATAQVMINRKWKVKNLQEFYPEEKSLLGLNVNHGFCIKVRLRSVENKNEFLPWESVLGTMIHELTHNSVNAHSAEFYKMMDEVYDEVEAKDSSNKSNTSTSQIQFTFGTGNKLGGGSVRSDGGLRGLSASAAMKRSQRTSSSGGCVLGGQSAGKDDLRRKMAESAEQRLATTISKKIRPLGDAQLLDIAVSSRSTTVLWSCHWCLESNSNSVQQCRYCGCDSTPSNPDTKKRKLVFVIDEEPSLLQKASFASKDSPLCIECVPTTWSVGGVCNKCSCFYAVFCRQQPTDTPSQTPRECQSFKLGQKTRTDVKKNACGTQPSISYCFHFLPFQTLNSERWNNIASLKVTM